MRNEDKPFVLYRRSRWNFSIMPRGPRGWVLLGLWLALLAPPTIAFVLYAAAHEGRPELRIATVLFLAGALVWSIAMTAWMKARAEVINVGAPLPDKRTGKRGRGR